MKLTTKQVANLLDFSQSMIIQLCNESTFPNAEKFANSWAIPKEDVANYLEMRLNNGKAEVDRIQKTLEEIRAL